ncbi:MAG TPA: hypothetical protein VF290_20850 [Pyrinomonadaceae bacterium]
MKPGRPSAILTIDGRALSVAEAAVAALTVVLQNGSHHWAEIVVWPESKFASVKPGASISVALGTVDSEEDVLAGKIASISQSGAAVVLEALGTTAELSQTRRSQTYVSQSIADIVRDLAGPVDIDEVDSDVRLQAYSVDDRRSVWGHLLDLSRLTGAELGSSASGGLRFVPVRSGSATRKFRHGADLLEWKIAANRSAEKPLAIAPHGAGSEAGQEKWHWLLHDPVGSSGKPSQVVGGFHSRDASDNLNQALEARVKRASVWGSLRVVGESKVRPGEIVAVDGLPGDDPGALRVLEVRHAFDDSGFITQLAVEGGGADLGLSL